MGQYDDQMNMRRERREAMRKKQQAEQRRLKIALIFAAIVLVACVVGLIIISRNTDHLAIDSAPTAESRPQETVKATLPPEETRSRTQQNTTATTIHIKATGDLNVTDSVVNSGLASSGYDYTRSFMDVAPILSDADLTVVNFEGNIYGQPYGTGTTSAPAEILTGLRNAGVDLLQMANSCSVNNGLNGLASTLQAIRNAGLEPIGAFANSGDFNASKGFTMCEVQGIKVAFVSFTKGLGGRGLPAGNEDCVNLLYNDYSSTYDEIDRDGIRAILRNVKDAAPDITIALLHWGSEYNDVISDTQKSIVSLMQKEGVNVIIGTHPHTLQYIDFNEKNGTLVAYSLGDFFGDATRGGTNYSVILDVEITKDPVSSTTKVTDFSYTPIYTIKTTDSVEKSHRVVRIDEAMTAYNTNYVDKITQACNDDMIYSLTRIKDRLTTPPAED